MPAQGGLYDQDPELLDDWSVISSIYAEVEQERLKSSKNNSMSPAKNKGMNFKRVGKVPPIFNNYFKQKK